LHAASKNPIHGAAHAALAAQMSKRRNGRRGDGVACALCRLALV
jgi:hypothetical protein